MAEVFNGGEEDVPVPETGPSIITSDSGEQGANDSEITHISNLISQGQKEEVDNQHSVKQLNDLEENVSVVTDLEKKIQELEEENKSKELLETAIEVIKTSLSSLQEQERISSSKNEEVEALKSHVAHLQEEVSDKQEELSKSQERERKAAQDNSRLQARLSNAQTYGDHHASMLQKLRHEITTLQDRNKTLEKHNLQRDSSLKNTQVEQQVVRESHQKLQERICELEEKVIKVNEEKQKLKADYDEAVKALEAVDKVYKVREATLEKYKADFEEASDRLKESEREVARLKSDLSKNKDKLTRALEYKSDREELKDQLRRSKEAKVIQMEETEQVRKDLEEERHQLKMAQSRAQERGRKIQMLNLELAEVKDTLAVARNVIEEKQKNMTSIKESLAAEKHKNSELEKEVELLSHVQKKLKYVQEEKHTWECKLKLTEVDLRETQTSLGNTNIKRKELEQSLEKLEKEKIHLNLQLEEKGSEAKKLKEVIEQKDDELDDALMEIVQANNSIDDLRDQLEDVLMSYQNDREWWKQKADRALGRRPKSAPPKREPARGTLSLSNRRLMKKMGTPGLNQSFLNSQHKIAWQRPPPTGQEQTPKLTTPENGNYRDASSQRTSLSNVPSGENGAEHHKFLEVSPSPPRVPPSERPRPNRPVSSYGVRTHPPPSWLTDDLERGMGYHSDMEAVIEDSRYDDYDADNEATVSTCAVHKGDKVMIQSQISDYAGILIVSQNSVQQMITWKPRFGSVVDVKEDLDGGEEKLNVTGMVKYVGKIGRENGGSVFVGLKLDQPVGNTNGRFGRKQYFQCLPRHGKMVKLSDIHAIMNPRTRNFTRIRPMTVDY